VTSIIVRAHRMSKSVGDGCVWSREPVAPHDDGFDARLLSLLSSPQRKNSERNPKSTVHTGNKLNLVLDFLLRVPYKKNATPFFICFIAIEYYM